MLIDLSVALNMDTPAYPGDPSPVITPVGRLEKDGFCDHVITVSTHLGTHVDAPMHMLADGESLAQIPISRWHGRGVLVPVTEGSFESVLRMKVAPGDVVLFETGLSLSYHEAEYFEAYPAMTTEVADFLVDRRVSFVGVDACSVDNEVGFPIHKRLLSNGVLIAENLANLAALHDVGTFEVFALPIKLELDGGPARVFAQTL